MVSTVKKTIKQGSRIRMFDARGQKVRTVIYSKIFTEDLNKRMVFERENLCGFLR